MNTETRVVTMIISDYTEKAFHCAIPGDERKFYLPRAHVRPLGDGKARFNQPYKFEIPEWLALNHRQICGDDAFEENKARKKGNRGKAFDFA
jgi:hypothetical protein